MEYNDQEFLDEIRALLDDNAPAADGPAAKEPTAAPGAASEAPAPEAPAAESPTQEAAPRRVRKRSPKGHAADSRRKKKGTPADPLPEESAGADAPRSRRTRRPVRRASFPWALLFLTILVVVGLAFALGQYLQDMNAPETIPTETVPAETEAALPGQTLTIAAVGDITMSDDILAAAMQPDGSFDFSQTFLHVSPILTKADLAVANLELNFCGEPYGSATRSAPYALAEALSKAGIDLVQMANSYSILNGIDGLSSTLTAVRQAGMEPLGAYADDASFQQSQGITICEVNGIRVAFIAFTKGMDNLSLPEGHDHCVNLLYKDYDTTYQNVDTEGITQILEAAAAQKPDVTIAMVHWGSEYSTKISRSQEVIRSLLLDGGVDAILGTHSHKVGTLTVDSKGSRSTVTAYSLGNFYGDNSRTGIQGSLALQLTFTMDNLTGRAKLTNVTYTPLYIASPSQSFTGSYQVLDLQNAITLKEIGYIGSVSQETYEILQNAQQVIRDSLGTSLDKWLENQS